MKIRYLAAGLLSAFVALTCYSLDRSFPQNAKRGKMALALYPSVRIDGQMRKLAPGARIWNQENLIQMPNSLGSRPYVVNYTEDGDGAIDRVWILTDGEAARRAPRQHTDTQ